MLMPLTLKWQPVFFFETGTTKEVPDSFHGWKFKKKNKYATILQRSLNWDTTFWGGGKNWQKKLIWRVSLAGDVAVDFDERPDGLAINCTWPLLVLKDEILGKFFSSVKSEEFAKESDFAATISSTISPEGIESWFFSQTQGGTDGCFQLEKNGRQNGKAS